MNRINSILRLLKPGIPRRYLLVIAGIAWTTGGGLLVYRGYSMMKLTQGMIWLKIAGSIVAGIIFYIMMFSKISLKHIHRIVHLESDKPCLFSFVNFRSYLLMALMNSFGITLRMTGIVSPNYLSIFYIGMGSPLLISALRFYYYGINFHKAVQKMD